MKLGLGICARNEEAGIITCITSVVRSAESDLSLKWELVICLNGCTDRTAHLVTEWLAVNQQYAVRLETMATANLVAAQRIVAHRLKDNGASIIIFFDADILVDQRCIPALLRTASLPSVKVAYARSLPFKQLKETIVEKTLNLYDTSAAIFTERCHLHGRAFLIKEWHIPDTDPPLLADDIYISCDLLHRYGPHAIAPSPEACVYFHQVSTVADFYRSQKRRAIELEKCLLLFPHFRSLPAEQLNRRILWRKLLHESLHRKLLWLLLLTLRSYSKARLRVEALLFREHTAWEITRTSKQSI